MIFRDVLSGFHINMFRDTSWVYDTRLNRRCANNVFVLPYVCRQIYTETATLPYALNLPVVRCHEERDASVASRNFARLEAIRKVYIGRSSLVDAINGTNSRCCQRRDICYWCCTNVWEPPAAFPETEVRQILLMPFSLVFPNLRRLYIGKTKKLLEAMRWTGIAD